MNERETYIDGFPGIKVDPLSLYTFYNALKNESNEGMRSQKGYLVAESRSVGGRCVYDKINDHLVITPPDRSMSKKRLIFDFRNTRKII